MASFQFKIFRPRNSAIVHLKLKPKGENIQQIVSAINKNNPIFDTEAVDNEGNVRWKAMERILSNSNATQSEFVSVFGDSTQDALEKMEERKEKSKNIFEGNKDSDAIVEAKDLLISRDQMITSLTDTTLKGQKRKGTMSLVTTALLRST